MDAYEGKDMDQELLGLIRWMGKTQEYRDRLQSLQTVWDNLTLLGHLSGTSTDMTDTRAAFQKLSGSLLNQLGRETLKKSVLAMKSKAQVAVDIMVRNLFERTADIGFLAMDDDVREYLTRFAPLKSRLVTEEARSNLERSDAGLLARFREYVQKYSVYSNIILLDTTGNVLLQLDEDNPARHSDDPLIAESLTTTQAYVETFRHSDLQPRQDRSHIYSYRVISSDGRQALGVLCLCFKFTNEAEGIFSNLVHSGDWSVVTLLDHRGMVIASSDIYLIPVGATVHYQPDHDWCITRFAGREYLATTRATQGYQGYQGPGWYGHVMLPLDHAFDEDSSQSLKSFHKGALESVMSNSSLFSKELREIPYQAAQIQRALNRSVWNGNVTHQANSLALNPAFSKILLWEISATGLKTQDVFDQSINNLHQTVVSSILQDSQFQAALAIDIMDRNLYERANDCRWWALAPVLRRALSSTVPDAALSAAAHMLSRINSLYTVYDNLLVFDKTGHVLCVSNPEYQKYCGETLDEDWVRKALVLSGPQSYTASRFSPSPMYKGRHTYIYAAAIHDPDNHNVVGGIGIVFDAAPQFEAMLNDALPRDEKGKVLEGCFAVFADRQQTVIASTQPGISPGTIINIEGDFFQLKNGEREAGIVVFNDRYYGIGACMSQGYREYKGSQDAYQNDVVALVFTLLGEYHKDRRKATPGTRGQIQNSGIKSAFAGESLEIATFFVDSNWLGIPTKYVVEAIGTAGLTTVPGAASGMLGYIMYRDKLITVVGLWGVLGKEDKRRISQEPQIIVLRLGEQEDMLLGVMVDELGEIPEIPLERIEKVSSMLGGGNALGESLVKPEEGKSASEMIVILSPERLLRKFHMME